MKMLGSISVCYLSILWFSLPFMICTRAADDVTVPTSLPITAESSVDQHGSTKEASSSDSVASEKKPSLASKFAIQEPKLVRTTEQKDKFRLDYPINDLITMEYTKFKVYESDCKQEFVMEGGPLMMNRLERFSSINENDNEDSQLKAVVLDFDYMPGNYRPSWYQLFRSYWNGNNHHELEICLRFMIFNRPTTNPHAIEVNFKESIVRMEIEKGGGEGKPTSMTNVTIEHVEPVGIQVHVLGESRAQVVTEEESPATTTTTTTGSTPSSDEPKKLREDLIQQKLQEMLEREKKQKQLLKKNEIERPKGALEDEL